MTLLEELIMNERKLMETRIKFYRKLLEVEPPHQIRDELPKEDCAKEKSVEKKEEEKGERKPIDDELQKIMEFVGSV